jgi:hypothetical protein
MQAARYKILEKLGEGSFGKYDSLSCYLFILKGLSKPLLLGPIKKWP